MTIIMLTLARMCMVIIVTGFYDGIWMVTENVIDAFINIINNHNVNICVVLKKGLILTIPHFTIPSYDKLLTVHFVCWIILVVKSILGLYIKQDTRKVLTEQTACKRSWATLPNVHVGIRIHNFSCDMHCLHRKL